MNNNRRTFLRQSALAGAGLFVAPNVFSFRGSPNSKVIVGIMGTNSRGLALARMFAKNPDVEVAGICDVDSDVVAKTIAEVEKVTGRKPKGMSDVRKLLGMADLDAMVIAAPDHWHAPAAIMGVKAGKHVYVEKPCSHSPAEGELLIQVAQKYGRLVQLGTQRRSFPVITEGIQALHDGVIGRVYYARGWYANNRKSIGTGKVVPVPSNLDFDLWQGPAPRRPYKDNLIHYNWHWFWNWGTGEALNNGTHEIDLMRWGLNVDYPSKVISAGGRFAFKDDWETPDTQTITIEFPNNTAISWEGRSCNDFKEEGSGRGVIFYGEKGTMLSTGGDEYKIFELGSGKLLKDAKASTEIKDETNTMGMGEVLDGMHITNFVRAVQEKEKLTAPIEEGHKSTLLPQLGNIAYRSGATLYCDPSNGHIVGNADANKLWSREYEAGWEVVA
jgi:predicted dehydrogenase